jgi:hypothetical protein
MLFSNPKNLAHYIIFSHIHKQLFLINYPLVTGLSFLPLCDIIANFLLTAH